MKFLVDPEDAAAIGRVASDGGVSRAAEGEPYEGDED